MDQSKKFILEAVKHLNELKEKIDDLNCDTDESVKTLSLVMDEDSLELDNNVETNLKKIDDLLENVTGKLKLRDLLYKKVTI